MNHTQYRITKQWSLNLNVQVFLLKVLENTEYINYSIIPTQQQLEISKYSNDFDRKKRLLSRSFLFEYCRSLGDKSDFDFSYNKLLKPYFNHLSYKFSFSYANEYVLIGISHEKEIGVDIEYKSSTLDFVKIAPQVMHVTEINFLKASEAADKINYFYSVWSGKESVVKALGYGLHYPIDQINLTPENTSLFKFQEKEYVYYELSELYSYAVAVSFEK